MPHPITNFRICLPSIGWKTYPKVCNWVRHTCLLCDEVLCSSAMKSSTNMSVHCIILVLHQARCLSCTISPIFPLLGSDMGIPTASAFFFSGCGGAWCLDPIAALFTSEIVSVLSQKVGGEFFRPVWRMRVLEYRHQTQTQKVKPL